MAGPDPETLIRSTQASSPHSNFKPPTSSSSRGANGWRKCAPDGRPRDDAIHVPAEESGACRPREHKRHADYHRRKRMWLRILAAGSARALLAVAPSTREGAGNAGRCCTRSLVCKGRTHTSIHHRSAKRSGIPCAIVLRLTSCSRRSTGLDSLRRLAGGRQHSRGLIPASGGPGPHDFAVRPARRSSRATQSVHRIPRHARDDRDTPLLRGAERGRLYR